MTKGDDLRYGAPRNAVHLRVDMQRMSRGRHGLDDARVAE